MNTMETFNKALNEVEASPTDAAKANLKKVFAELSPEQKSEAEKVATERNLGTLLSELKEVSVSSYSLETLGETIQNPQAKEFFAIYQKSIDLVLKDVPWVETLSIEEKESLRIVLWSVEVESFSIKSKIWLSLNNLKPDIENGDGVLDIATKFFGWKEKNTTGEKTPEAKWFSFEEIKTILGGEFKKYEGNMEATLSLNTETRGNIFKNPQVLEALIKKASYTDERWNIDLSKEEKTIPSVWDKEAGEKYIVSLASETEEIFKNNDRIEKVVHIAEKIFWNLEDWFKNLWPFGAGIASMIVWLKKIFGGISLPEIWWNSSKKSLETLATFLSTENGKSLGEAQGKLLSSLTPENSRIFFDFLNKQNVDTNIVDFWSLTLSGRKTDGSDGEEIVKKDENLRKVKEFLQSTLSEPNTSATNFAEKVSKISESPLFTIEKKEDISSKASTNPETPKNPDLTTTELKKEEILIPEKIQDIVSPAANGRASQV